MPYRVYIDESGDHSYSGLPDLGRRYLGLTAIVIHQTDYNPAVPRQLEDIKRRHLPYDADFPVVLHRKDIIQKRLDFSRLQDPLLARDWDDDMLSFLTACPMQIFTVVFDKKAHVDHNKGVLDRAYPRCLVALLETIATWLALQPDSVGDILLESRGTKSDSELQRTYESILRLGTDLYAAERFQAVFPKGALLFGGKQHNVAGLQIADLLAADQAKLAIQEAARPLAHASGNFGQRLNAAMEGKAGVNGRSVIQ